jgi:hypothetical protein
MGHGTNYYYCVFFYMKPNLFGKFFFFPHGISVCDGSPKGLIDDHDHHLRHHMHTMRAPKHDYIHCTPIFGVDPIEMKNHDYICCM